MLAKIKKILEDDEFEIFRNYAGEQDYEDLVECVANPPPNGDPCLKWSYNRWNIYDQIRRNILEIKSDYQCMDPKGELMSALTDTVTIGKGCFGVVYKSAFKKNPKFKFAIKQFKFDKKSEYTEDTKIHRYIQKWHEIIFLREVNKLSLKVCQNLPYLHKFYSCLDVSGKENPYLVLLIELADGDLDSWFKTKPSYEAQHNCLFQIMAGIHTLQTHLQMVQNDIKAANILFFQVPIIPDSYFQYTILGKKYYLPNLGLVFVINDFGVSTSLSPKIDLIMVNKRSDKTKMIGQRFAIVDGDEILPLNYTQKSIKFRGQGMRGGPMDVCDTAGKLYGTVNIMPNAISHNGSEVSDGGMVLTGEQIAVLKKYNLPVNPLDPQFFSNINVVPALEMMFDVTDAIRIFTGGKRASQDDNHKVSPYVHPRLLKELQPFKNPFPDGYHVNNVELFHNRQFLPATMNNVLAGHFIRMFFPELAVKPANAVILSKNRIS